MNTNNKKDAAWLCVEMSQLLEQYDCTYSEADKAIKLLTDYIKSKREELDLEIVFETKTIFRYVNHHRSDDQRVESANHFSPYC